MSVSSGFFNSVRGDRKYTAEQFTSLFDGIINDGVFMSIGDALKVKVSESKQMTITIGTGRAWFNHTWTYVDSPYTITLAPGASNRSRIDTIILDVDKDRRYNELNYMQGYYPATAEEEPQKRTLINTATRHQYPLAYVRVNAGATDLTQADIENAIGTRMCPYVTGILETVTIDGIVAQWEEEFDQWFNSLEVILDGDVATNLARRIVDLEAISIDFDTLPVASSIKLNDVFLLHGADGQNKKINSNTFAYAIFDTPYINVSTKRNMWRGEYLGDSVSYEQYEAIWHGEFTGLCLGDYWSINDNIWRIVDFDYWHGSLCSEHHLVIMPDHSIGSWNKPGPTSDDGTAGGYGESGLRNALYDTSSNIRDTIISAFGEDHILKHQELLVNGETYGRPTSVTWYNSDIEIPSEIMIFGCHINSPSTVGLDSRAAGSPDTVNDTIDNQQLAGFRASRGLLVPEALGYWLRDVASDSKFTYVGSAGVAITQSVYNLGNIRPVFGLVYSTIQNENV